MSDPAALLRVPADAGDVLLPLARAAIAARLGEELPRPDETWLDLPGASFVTLILRGALRGCIGSVTARRPLGDDVAANARAAAFRDPRFPPLTAEEFADIRIEVSVLTPPKLIPAASRQDALAELVPGKDGVIVDCRQNRATFLPQVWRHLPDPDRFLRALMLKADLPPNHWDSDTTLARYRVCSWSEPVIPPTPASDVFGAPDPDADRREEQMPHGA